jgi:uncharacterized lipoprotein YbaY
MKLHVLVILGALVAAGCSTSVIEHGAAASEINASEATVSGRVIFAPGSVIPAAWKASPVSGIVKVIDTTAADAPSADVASATFTATDGAPITFELQVPHVDATRAYSIVVHIDADGDGQTSAGDFITMESFPVLTDGHGSVVDVRVAQVEAPPATTKVSGRVLLSGETADLTFPFAGVVEVLDVTYADAPSTTVGSRPIMVAGPAPIPFEMDVADIDPRRSYAVSVHLDSDGDASISKGDFITMESFPVLTNGHGSHLDVTARRY